MTNYLPVEQLARKARNITSSEDASLAGLGEIIIKCESAALTSTDLPLTIFVSPDTSLPNRCLY